MSLKWVKVFSTQIGHIGEIVKGLIEEENIKTFIINKRDSLHTHLGIGDIEIYVQSHDVIRAKYLISKTEF